MLLKIVQSLLFIWAGARAIEKIPRASQKQTGSTTLYSTILNHWVKFVILKRQCHEIFYLYFFHELNPFGSLINRLKLFHWKIRFHEDIHEKRESVQCETALSRTPHSIALQQVQLHSYHTVLSWEIEISENPKLSNIARSLTLRICAVL